MRGSTGVVAPEDVLQFWFGDPGRVAEVAKRQSRLWWSKDPGIDREIRERFGPAVDAVAGGGLRDWLETVRGRLALIVTADQFPRSMFRDTPRAFATDAVALGWCLEAIESAADRSLQPLERMFLYMPMQHSEMREVQEKSVAQFEALRDAAPGDDNEPLAGAFDFAIRHRDIIARFGRFPHRNVILGRRSTPEEIEFLRQPGSSF